LRYFRSALVLCTLLLFLMIPGILWAHPASSLDLTYDKDSSILEVVASHGVSDVSSHYIDRFEVFLDGKRYCELEVVQQFSLTEAVALFKLPVLKSGVLIEVEVDCNKFGKRKASVTVE